MIDLLLRLCWFYLIGLWLGIIWLKIAWFFCLTIIGMPIGVWMINVAPVIFTLKESGEMKEVEVKGKIAYYFDEVEQPPFLMRALWFLVIGWWASFLWSVVALFLAATFIGMPIGFWMINRLPFVVSLSRE